jgi:alpha/beta superfamily hydrolase
MAQENSIRGYASGAAVIVAVTRRPNATVATLGGQPETHMLGKAFWNNVRSAAIGLTAVAAVVVPLVDRLATEESVAVRTLVRPPAR